MTGIMNEDLIISLIFVFTIVFSFIYFILLRNSTYYNKDVEERHSSPLVSRTFRKFWFWFIEKPLHLLVKTNIDPDIVTLISFIFAAFSAFLYSRGIIIYASWVLAISGTFDILDGRLARLKGTAGKRGVFWDSCIDRFSDSFIFIGILYYFRNDLYFFCIVSIILVSTTGISYFRAKAESLGVKNDVGMMQRPERIAILSSLGVLSPFISIGFNFSGLEITSLQIFKGVLIFLAATTMHCAIYRLLNGYRALKENAD